MVWNPNASIFMARWGPGYKSAHSSEVELDLLVSGQGSNWWLLLLPLIKHAESIWWLWFFYCRKSQCYSNSVQHA
ncbi:hypothetical protein ACS0TY_011033 [Phlomoides rotata]